MRRRFAPRGALLFAVLPFLAALAGCDDEPPTLGGDEFFPGGGRPVTLEVTVPAAEFLRQRAVYTNFTTQNSAGFLVLANQFDGALNAHGLVRFSGFPADVSFVQDGASFSVVPYTVRSGLVVVRIDTLASARPGPVTLEVYELAQPFDPGSATWELAVDTAGNRTPWTQPGGTRGPLLTTATLAASGIDSVTFALDSVTLNRLRSGDSPGLLLRPREANTRLQVGGLRLNASVRPQAAGAPRDTTLTVNVESGPQTFVFTPQPPQPAGTLQAGGIYSTRTVFDIDFLRPLPGCPAGQTCAPVTLADVRLNRVALLLRPLTTPNGYRPLTRLPLTLRTVPEPELGRRAPLGENALDVVEQSQVAIFEPADTVVEIPLTAYAFRVARGDTLPTTFALLSEDGTGGVPTFGVGIFDPAARLRIVYTLPVRPRLP